MKTLSSTTAENADSLLDQPVLDQTGAEIGTVHSFWADSHTGNLEFLGVKTGWLFGHNHIIPADKAQIDEAAHAVRVPYEAEFVKGALSLDADATISDAQEAEILRYYGVGSAKTATASRAAATTTATTATTTGKDTIEVPLTEESVRVGKRTVEAGQVRLRKIVRTEIVNQPVEIRHEDVVVERVTADQVRAGTAASDFKEEVIDVPLTREEVVVQKDARVTGAVRLHKTSESERQNVSETVRKEDVEVVRDGKAVVENADVSKG